MHTIYSDLVYKRNSYRKKLQRTKNIIAHLSHLGEGEVGSMVIE